MNAIIQFKNHDETIVLSHEFETSSKLMAQSYARRYINMVAKQTPWVEKGNTTRRGLLEKFPNWAGDFAHFLYPKYGVNHE